MFLGGWIADESVAIKSAQIDLQTSSWYRSTRLDLLFQAGYRLIIGSEVITPKRGKTPQKFSSFWAVSDSGPSKIDRLRYRKTKDIVKLSDFCPAPSERSSRGVGPLHGTWENVCSYIYIYIYIYIDPYQSTCRRRAWMDLAENLYDWSLGVYLQTIFAAFENFHF